MLNLGGGEYKFNGTAEEGTASAQLVGAQFSLQGKYGNKQGSISTNAKFNAFLAEAKFGYKLYNGEHQKIGSSYNLAAGAYALKSMSEATITAYGLKLTVGAGGSLGVGYNSAFTLIDDNGTIKFSYTGGAAVVEGGTFKISAEIPYIKFYDKVMK